MHLVPLACEDERKYENSDMEQSGLMKMKENTKLSDMSSKKLRQNVDEPDMIWLRDSFDNNPVKWDVI